MQKLMYSIENMHKKYNFIPAFSPVTMDKQLMKMRLDFLQEELDEIREAIAEDSDEDFLDGIVDMLVVLMGTAHLSGLFPVLETAWYRVMMANMQKTRGVGKRGHEMDLVKPKGWKTPDMEDLIDRLYIGDDND